MTKNTSTLHNYLRFDCHTSIMTNKQYSTIIEMLGQLQSAVIGLATQLNKLEARVSSLEQKVSSLEGMVAGLEEKLDAHIATNEQQHQEIIDTLNEALNTVSNENDTSHFKFKTRLKNHETRLTGLEKIVLQ
jgi:chromosome segregation ATPase